VVFIITKLIMNKKKTINIGGMTCVSCEAIITDEMGKVEEIDEITVCHKKKTAEISFSSTEPNWNKVVAKIKKLGYEASFGRLKESTPKATKKQWFFSILVVFGFYIVYRYLKWIGLLKLLDVDASNVTYGVAILVGVVASLSTCLAVVGAVVISFAAKYESRGSFYQANVKPHLLFHLGRWITFFVLGGLLGLLGSWFNLSGSFMGWFTVLIAAVLAWMGLNILGVLPSLSTVGIRMPKRAMNTWNKLKDSEHALAPMVLGGFTFFLPCGFTQSMQLFAVSSGSFWTGGLTMLLFALGTAPVLIGLGITSSKFSHSKGVVLKKAIGFIVIIFAFYTLSSGLALAGLSVNLPTGGSSAEVSSSVDGEQVVRMTVDYSGFSPNVFKIKKGVPVKWIIDGEQVSGCTNEIIIPSLGVRKKIYPGENIIRFTPDKEGTIGFSCWMGMVRGKFIVQDGGVSIALVGSQDDSLNTTCSGGGECGSTCGTSGCGCGSN